MKLQIRPFFVIGGAAALAFTATFLGAGLSAFGAGAIAAGVAIIGAAIEMFREGARRLAILAAAVGLGICAGTPFLPLSRVITYSCWNGAVLAKEKCSEPNGDAGIQYVFPSYGRTDHCRQIENRPESIRYDCQIDDGVLVRYRYWRDTATASQHYDKERATDSREPLVLGTSQFGVFQWGRDEKSKLYRFTGITPGSHFSFTVASRDRQRGLDAVRELVRVRCPEHYWGFIIGEGPEECVAQP